MKKVLLFLTFVGLLVLALGGVAGAAPPALTGLDETVASTMSTGRPVWAPLSAQPGPSVSTVAPISAPNDIDTPVTITGSDFTAVMDGTGTVVLTAPTASLGATPLTDVTFVDSSTLTATVPWGMDPGTYDLTVTNPDGGSGSLLGAFTVQAGIGRWNPGDLYGGQMQQLLMKSDDPDTLYATAYGVNGLFRSTDAGEHWAFVTDKVWANNVDFVLDPLHPDRLYVVDNPDGLMRSTDEGDTWTSVMPYTWPDGRGLQAYSQVYVSPYQDGTHPQALFVSDCNQYVIPVGTGPQGLIKSTDGGVTWTIVQSLKDVPVQAIAFDPNDHSHMVLVTADVKVYTSSDWGDTWTQVTTTGLTPSTLGMGGSITYNPGGSEVWIAAPAQPVGGGVFKSAATDLTSWQDMSPSPGYGSWFLTFTGPSSVYISRFHSTTGGSSWTLFGPSPWYGGQANCVFDPTDPLTAYITNDAVGVQKTTDGGANWEPKVQGLTALSCTSLAVSPVDPLRVYAAFYGPLGIYRSLDGTSHWSFVPIPGSAQVGRVLVDPFEADRVYAGAASEFYSSADGGDTWSGGGWNLSPSSPSSSLVDMAADPYQPGHLLACFGTGGLPRLLYDSTDYGASWQAVDVHPGPGLYNPHCIAFDPATPGTVYFATDGVYKSIDHGSTWRRIDDPKMPRMANADNIAIATHPQPMVTVEGGSRMYRSVDQGATWQEADIPDYQGAEVFVDGDSRRLYLATTQGLFFSSDAGDSWKRAAGVIGQVQTTALGYADADGHTIIYAATNGGSAATTAGQLAAAPRSARAVATTMVGAGVYRYVVLPAPKLTLKLSGLRSSALKLGRHLTVAGKVTPTSLAGSKVKLSVQRKKVRRWVTVTTVQRTISSTGAYSWRYKPARRGSYRLRTTIARTTKTAAAATTWRMFKVK